MKILIRPAPHHVNIQPLWGYSIGHPVLRMGAANGERSVNQPSGTLRYRPMRREDEYALTQAIT
jgi:hypothetical protein